MPVPATCGWSAPAAGAIVPAEVARLREAGVTIFSPEDGQRLGLPGMVDTVIQACDTDLWDDHPTTAHAVMSGERAAVARAITAAETGDLSEEMRSELAQAASGRAFPVLGITGTGGSGNSSLTDELVRQIRLTSRTSSGSPASPSTPPGARGGALRGDRIRMDASTVIAPTSGHWRPAAAVRFPRPSATSSPSSSAGYDLVIVESPGIGQAMRRSRPTPASTSTYDPGVRSRSQLEKIDM